MKPLRHGRRRLVIAAVMHSSLPRLNERLGPLPRENSIPAMLRCDMGVCHWRKQGGSGHSHRGDLHAEGHIATAVNTADNQPNFAKNDALPAGDIHGEASLSHNDAGPILTLS